METMQKLAGVLAIACVSVAPVAVAQGVPAGKYAFQTVKANYFTAVNGGNVSGRNAINTDATRVSGWETFTIVPFSDGTYAIQTATANYVTALNGGGIGGDKVSLHTDAKTVNAWEKFGLIRQSDGTYAIRTSNGHYLTAVNGGGVGGGAIAIHTDATQINAWEKFKLVGLGATPVCTANITNAYWYLQNSATRVAFFPIDATTWTSPEVSYNDPNRRDYWGSYKCIGTNAWEFRTANNNVFQTLTLHADGLLYNEATGQAFKR